MQYTIVLRTYMMLPHKLSKRGAVMVIKWSASSPCTLYSDNPSSNPLNSTALFWKIVWIEQKRYTKNRLGMAQLKNSPHDLKEHSLSRHCLLSDPIEVLLGNKLYMNLRDDDKDKRRPDWSTQLLLDGLRARLWSPASFLRRRRRHQFLNLDVGMLSAASDQADLFVLVLAARHGSRVDISEVLGLEDRADGRGWGRMLERPLSGRGHRHNERQGEQQKNDDDCSLEENNRTLHLTSFEGGPT